MSSGLDPFFNPMGGEVSLYHETPGQLEARIEGDNKYHNCRKESGNVLNFTHITSERLRDFSGRRNPGVWASIDLNRAMTLFTNKTRLKHYWGMSSLLKYTSSFRWCEVLPPWYQRDPLSPSSKRLATRFGPYGRRPATAWSGLISGVY